VISVRLDDEMLLAVDLLVRAGLFQSRSEAASQLIKAGVQASGEWLRQAQEIADSVQKMKQAFMEAVKQKDVRTVSLLLEQDGRLAADYAEQTGDTPLLLERGADRAAQKDDGLTPLDLARENGHDAVIALLAGQADGNG
jgi:uncharacterized protein